MRCLCLLMLLILVLTTGPAWASSSISPSNLKVQVSTTSPESGIKAQFNGQVQIPRHMIGPLLNLLQNRAWGEVKLGQIEFEPTERAYVFAIEATVGWLWDNFDILVKTNSAGEICLQARGNWLPTSQVMDNIALSIQQLTERQVNQRNPYVHITSTIHYQDSQLCIMPKISSAPTANSAVFQESTGKKLFSLTPAGHLWITLRHYVLQATAERTSQHLLTRILKGLNMHLSSPLTTQDYPFQIQADLTLGMSPQDAEQIQLGQEKLSDRAEHFQLQASTQGQGKLTPTGEWQWQSQHRLFFPELWIANQRYQVSSEPIDISLNSRHPLDVHIEPRYRPTAAFQPSLSHNRVKLLIDGPAYYQALMAAFKQARHSISVEKFLYYDGHTTRQLGRLMALKAAGLIEKKGTLTVDPNTPNGISVHILHNHEFNREGVQLVERHFKVVTQSLVKQIQHSSLPKRAYHIANLKQQLQWVPLIRGVAKTDHRKIVIVDHQLAFVGGMNWGDHYLTADSKHDVMFALQGPAVQQIETNFAQNWREFSGKPYQVNTVPAVYRIPELGMSEVPLAVLTTDDQRTDIKSAVLTLIQQAQSSIQLEHAYFFHHEVLSALKQALSRGVTVQLMVPRHNDEALFEMLNTDAIRQLMEFQQTSRRGQFNAWYYTGKGGDHGYMAHTKAMVVDSRYVLVGSANLLPRSLQSPFTQISAQGHHQNILFNEEMSLYMDSPAMAQQLEQQVLEHDRRYFGKSLNYTEVLQRIQELGGAPALFKERLKAHFT